MGEGHSKISWGKVIAGAAIVAGAVLFAPTLMAAIPGGLMTIGHAITASIASIFASGAATGAGAASGLATALTGGVAKKIAGAALIGGGVSYFMGEQDRKDAAAENAMQQGADNSFAMREDMRRMQALMVARAQATGYAPAAAMAGQQR